jgi:hypothetical protein
MTKGQPIRRMKATAVHRLKPNTQMTTTPAMKPMIAHIQENRDFPP